MKIQIDTKTMLHNHLAFLEDFLPDFVKDCEYDGVPLRISQTVNIGLIKSLLTGDVEGIRKLFAQGHAYSLLGDFLTELDEYYHEVKQWVNSKKHINDIEITITHNDERILVLLINDIIW